MTRPSRPRSSRRPCGWSWSSSGTPSARVETPPRRPGVDEEILQALVALRSSAALNDYSSLEDQVLEVKSSVLRRGIRLWRGSEVRWTWPPASNEMTAQYEALRAQNYDAITRITAPVSGTFSAPGGRL